MNAFKDGCDHNNIEKKIVFDKFLPVIDISSRNFIETLGRSGYFVGNIFFKCTNSIIYKDYSDLFGRQIYDCDNYKHSYSAERAIVVCYGTKHIVGEFEQLLKIYRIAPENTATPIAIAIYKNSITGYFLEYIEGTPLYVFDSDFKRDIIYNTLVPLISKLHENKIGHGDISIGSDLNNGNILIKNDRTLRLIDPLPAYSYVDDKFRISADIELLDNLKRRF